MRSRVLLLLLQTLLCVHFACSSAPSTPEERYGLVVRARALFETGDGKGAEDLLRRVAESDPKADAWANLAWVQWSRGHRKDASRSWQTALDLDPSHARTLYSLTALQLRDLTEKNSDPRQDAEAWAAVRTLAERAGQSGAHSAALQRLLASVARAMGDTAAARKAQHEAERLDPGRAGAAPALEGLEGILLPRLRQVSLQARTPPHFVFAPGGHRALTVFPVDLDADGRLDVVLGGTPVILWAEAGHEGSSRRWQAADLLEEPATLVCASLFDGDASMDLVVFSQSADSALQRSPLREVHKVSVPRDTRVWLVRGGSRRPQTTWLFNMPVVVQDAQAIDADGDGDVDVALAVSEAPGLRLLRNEGGGRFAAATPLPGCAEFGPANRIRVSDVDGDAQDDLIVLDALGRIRVFAARTSGVFANLSAVTGLAGQRARVIGPADLDEDGDVDLVLGDDEGLWIWTNEGAGRFVRAAAYRDALGDWITRQRRGIPVAAVHLVDLDNDGLLDIVSQHFAAPAPVFATLSPATNGTEDTAPGSRRLEPLLDVPTSTSLAVWHNEDNMLFADVTAASGCGEIRVGAGALASGDFDGNGALDLVATGPDSTQLFLWSEGGIVHRRLRVELVEAARPAVGVRIALHWGTRAVYRTLRTPRSDFGILDASVADVLRVQWPDGEVQNHFDVPLPSEGPLRLRREP